MKKIKWIYFGWLVLTLSLGCAAAQSQGEKVAGKPAQTKAVTGSGQYIIGPEDVLHIHVWKEDALSRTIPVRVDGKISLPLIDDIQAAGLTPLELKEVINEKLTKFISNPTASVIVVEMNSFKVFVSGQIRAPGVYRLRSETTLVQLISMAGGFTEWADQKGILILRKEKGQELRITVNYKKALKGEIPSAQLVLKPGDTIIVP